MTLFPLGILRMAQAARAARSSMLSESASSDLAGRGMFYKPSFYGTWYGPPTRPLFDPFLVDPANPGAFNPATDAGVARLYGAGLPVAYDPLWWYETIVQSNGTYNPADPSNEASYRFGRGIGFLRSDTSGPPAAHGLQRITNFRYDPSQPNGPLLWNVEPIFASTDDLVYQTEGNSDVAGGFGNTTVPDMSQGAPIADLMFTWMFTGRQTDVGNARVFDGDIVVFHNRPVGLDVVNSPYGGQILKAPGETVVEAIWGYGPGVQDLPNYPSAYYALNSTSVLLRWPANVNEPDVRQGSWIADVTYERYGANASRYNTLRDPAQRCHWYRVVRRGDTTESAALPGDSGLYKQMIVTVDRPLRAQTPLAGPNSTSPALVEAALVSSYVVNVFPKVIIVQ
jgi:hypothetical protein